MLRKMPTGERYALMFFECLPKRRRVGTVWRHEATLDASVVELVRHKLNVCVVQSCRALPVVHFNPHGAFWKTTIQCCVWHACARDVWVVLFVLVPA